MTSPTLGPDAVAALPSPALDPQTASAIFAATFMTNPAAQAVTDFDTGRIIEANLAFYALMECTPAQVIGHTAAELNMWEDSAQRDDMIRRLLATGAVRDYEITVRTGSGRKLTQLASVMRVDLPDRRLIVTTAQDITGRKETEAQLRDLNRKNDEALTAAHAASWEYDVARRVFTFNDRFYALHGITDAPSSELAEDEFISRYVTPEFAAQVGGTVEHALAAEADVSFAVDGMLRRTDGSTFWVSTTIWPEQDAGGRTVRLRGFNIDITERKQAEIALRRSEERYRGLLESLDSVIAAIDYAGRLLYVNEVAARGLGRPVDDVIGKTLHEVFPEQLATEQLAAVRHVIDTDRSWVGESQSIVRDVPRWYRAAFQPIHDEKGAVVYALANATDIDDIKRAQQQLEELNDSLELRIQERTAELVSALKLRDEFLANMSHELRTPLNAILTLGETLQAGIYGSVNPAQDRALRHIESSGRHLLSLINDLLDLSKLDAGRLELDLEPVAVEQVCRAALLFVNDLAAKKQIQLDYANDCPDAVLEADGRRLKQVLVNLLDNAVKFTPAGGSATLHAGIGPGGDTLIFTVRDSGIGIAPADQGRLFQPFVQLDGSLARRYEGSGLGLALVKRLAEQHGGTVAVASSGVAGQGATFTVGLPYTPPATPGAAAGPEATAAGPEATGDTAPVTPAAGPRARILLAEDNELAILAMSEYLDYAGYAVTVARTGLEAVDYALAAPPPDLVLMDIQLPLLDGLSAIRRLRQEARLADVPIIATTALASADDRARCLAAGATAYLSKPMRMAELASLIATLIA